MMRSSFVSWLFDRRAFLTCLGVGATALLAVLVLWPSSSPAELAGPKANDRQVTLVVNALLKREHLSRLELDDAMARRGFQNFVKALDPMKLYFLKSDVAEFEKEQDKIDDMVKKGDISFAYTIFNRFLERVDQRVKWVDELLAEDHDFSADEAMVSDPDVAQFSEDDASARERWRKRIKYDLLVLKADKEDPQEALERLKRRYHSFAKRMEQTSSDELLEMYLTAITTGYDPHTTYMSPSTLENFYIQMRLNLEGIGAALQLNDGYTKITKVIPGGAADKHGKLKPDDRIVSVGQGVDGEMVDVVDMKLGDVVAKIRGKAGTVVRLGVIPASGGELRIYNITRAKIDLTDSEARGVVFEAGQGADGKPLKVGVIDLPSFYMDMAAARKGVPNFKSTTRDVRKILDGFREKGVDAVVLDLRRNGGGSLTEAINLTGLFIDRGPVVQVKDADGNVQHYDDLDAGMAWQGPLVVVTSKFSASASEILAGAIQDYGRGLIVGDDATHGKGTVQSLLNLGEHLFRVPNPPNLGALKITMQQFYRPNGDSTQKRGVLADVALPSITTHMDIAEADLDFAIPFDQVKTTEYQKFGMVPAPMLRRLQEASKARIAANDDFDKVTEDIKQYREQKQRKEVTLNEQAFMAERARFDADKEEREQLEETVNPSDEIVKRDYYFEEVLNVSIDYVNELRKQNIAAAASEKPAG